jgi:hypothetical protein
MKSYIFQVITSLPPPEEGPNLSFHTLDEQLDLLGKVGVFSTHHLTISCCQFLTAISVCPTSNRF